MFLIEALKMTDKVNIFNKAGAAMQRAAGYRQGMQRVPAYNLAKAFQKRNITLEGMDVFPGQNEK